MSPPLVIVEGDKLNPHLKVLIFTLDDTRLPFFVVTDVVIGVVTVMLVVFGLFVSLGCIDRFERRDDLIFSFS